MLNLASGQGCGMHSATLEKTRSMGRGWGINPQSHPTQERHLYRQQIQGYLCTIHHPLSPCSSFVNTVHFEVGGLIWFGGGGQAGSCGLQKISPKQCSRTSHIPSNFRAVVSY